MASVSKAYGATGTSDLIHISPGQTYTYVVTGSATATWVIEYTTDHNNWIEVATGTADQTSVTASNDTTGPKGAIWVRSQCTSYGSGTMTVVTADAADTVKGTEIIDDDGTSVFKAVDGGVEMGGTLAVTGATTQTGAVAMASTLAVTGVTTQTGQLNAGVLSCSGAATITGVTTQTGQLNAGVLSCSGAATITGAATHTSTTLLSDNVTMADAKNIILNASTGTKIGTATSQKLGFFNATPVVQQTALTAADATALDNTYDSTEQTTVSNMRVRINEIATLLANLGLTA